jgi:histone H3/H4
MKEFEALMKKQYKAMTLKECKDEIAKKRGYKDAILGSPWDFFASLNNRKKVILEAMDEVAKLYALSVATDALRQAGEDTRSVLPTKDVHYIRNAKITIL